MTIITKPLSDKASDKQVEKAFLEFSEKISDEDLKAIENLTNLANLGSRRDGGPGEEEGEAWLSPSTRRRVSTTTTVCAFILALVVMSIGIIGGVYLYRQLAEHKMSRFKTWCGVPIKMSSLHLKDGRYLGVNHQIFTENNDAEWGLPGKANLFRAKFDLDLDSGLYESIDVPDFGIGREGRFIHDYNSNKTCIIDMTSGNCYIFPLDRKHIKPPEDLFHVILNMLNGMYNVNTTVLPTKMRILKQVVDKQELGGKIAEACKFYPTFHTTTIRRDPRFKRSAKKQEEPVTLVEFAGNNVIQYEIFGKTDTK